MRKFVGMALSALLAGMPAAAQAQHAHAGPGMHQDSADHGMMGPGMHQGGMMGHGMMGMMGSAGGPGAILDMRTALKLTPDQVTRLQQIQQRTQKEIAAAMQEVHDAAAQARQALDAGTPDLKGYEAAVRAMTEPMIAAHVTRARGSAEARQLLTPEQRKQLQAGPASGIMAMRSGMMGGSGTGHCAMMGGNGTVHGAMMGGQAMDHAPIRSAPRGGLQS